MTIPSPQASGGAGDQFEIHVSAFFLALLLVDGSPPVLMDSAVTNVQFQSRHLGWRTDDILLTAKETNCTIRKLAIQVKRSFSVPSDESNFNNSESECIKTFKAFWTDYNNDAIFNKESDELALVVLRATATLVESLGPIFDCARASGSANDFFSRIKTEGYINKKAVAYVNSIRKMISEGSEISDDEFWKFLRKLHLINYDFTTSTSQTEALTKNLLALSIDDAAPATASNLVWSELVVLAASFRPQAKSIDKASLISSVKHRFKGFELRFGKFPQSLKSHSEFVFRKIDDTIGESSKISRSKLLDDVLNSLSSSQIVIISGDAGAGKSALAKTALVGLASDNIIAAFRAEEFDAAHLDSVFKTTFDVSALEFEALLCAHPKKIILIESVERLLESEKKEAFSDLILILKNNPSLKLVLTCRAYSVETVRANFLFNSHTSQIDVPILSEGELRIVIDELPNLHPILNNSDIIQLLRNPFYLKLACRMSWSGKDSKIAHEESFRKKFWQDIIQNNSVQKNSLHLRREKAFIELGIRRVSQMKEYVSISDLDPIALQALHNDGLISYREENNQLAAPSHDVLEDWAVINFIEQQFEVYESELEKLPDVLGTAPAVRRSYRYWLKSAVEANRQNIEKSIVAIVKNKNIPNYFRDDTLIAAISSSNAPDFIANSSLLKDDDGSILRKLIHLTRVACKISPKNVFAESTGILVASGNSWPSMAKAISKNLDLLKQDTGLAVNFLMDYLSIATVEDPYPDGSKEVTEIAFTILDKLGRYGSEEQQKALVSVILKFPLSSQDQIIDLATRAASNDTGDFVAEIFLEKAVSGFTGVNVCRDLPDIAIELALAKFFKNHNDDEDESGPRYSDFRSIENLFGFNDQLRFEFYPPSALRGPFYYLLKFNAEKGLRFIIDFFNKSCDTYGTPISKSEKLRRPWKIEITLPSGVKKQIWFDGNLWGAYRGLNTSPTIFECALRALEKWLLELASSSPEDAVKWAHQILEQSNNTATLSVLASVSIAFPKLFCDIGFSALTNKDLIILDLERAVHEELSIPRVSQIQFSDPSQENVLHYYEVNESNKLPHRRYSLETFCFELQNLSMREKVLQLLDHYIESLPDLETQDDHIKKWRISLFRMDSRNHKVVEIAVNDDAQNVPGVRPRFAIESAPLPEDLKQLGKDLVLSTIELNKLLVPLNWGNKSFEQGHSDTSWRDHLTFLQTEFDNLKLSDEDMKLGANTPMIVALVCLRDHFEEMDEKSIEWCMQKIEEIVDRLDEDDLYSYSRMIELQKVAIVFSKMLNWKLDPEIENRIRKALAKFLLSKNTKLQFAVAKSVGTNLANERSSVVDSMLNVVVSKALEMQQLERGESGHYELNGEEVDIQTIYNNCCELGISDETCQDSTFLQLKLDSPFSALAIVLSLLLLSKRENAPKRLMACNMFANWYCQAKKGREGRERFGDINFYGLNEIAKIILGVNVDEGPDLLKQFVAAIKTDPDAVAELLDHLIIVASDLQNFDIFWKIWKLFADELVLVLSKGNVGSRSLLYAGILKKLFFNIPWGKEVLEWPILNDRQGTLDSFFLNLPLNKDVLKTYLSFLLRFGSENVLHSLKTLYEKLSSNSHAAQLLADWEIMNALEILLRRQIVKNAPALKEDQIVKQSTLGLLDMMIDGGSSAAYQLRENFLTPNKTT